MSAGFFSQPTSAKPTVVLSDDEESDEENTKSDPAITADEESSAMIRKMMSNKVPLLFLFIILYDVRNEHNTHRILEDILHVNWRWIWTSRRLSRAQLGL